MNPDKRGRGRPEAAPGCQGPRSQPPHSLLQRLLAPGLAAVALLAALAAGGTPVNAQASAPALRLVVIVPGNGEHFYISPSSFIAVVPFTGQVLYPGARVTDVQVRLDVQSPGGTPTRLTARPDADGFFAFYFNLSPAGLMPVSLHPGDVSCDRCHFRTEFSLPDGEVRLTFTASAPAGEQAVVSRQVTIARGGFASVPVQIVLQGAGSEALAGLNVQAATRLYDWRARQVNAFTDAAGRSTLKLEALSQATTQYTVSLKPSVVDGVLFSSVEPVTVTLVPGATSLETVYLPAAARSGRIGGRIQDREPGLPAFTIRAVELPGGAAHTAQAPGADFSFPTLPVRKYLLSVDAEEAAAQGRLAIPREVDLIGPALAGSPQAAADLTLARTAGRTARGTIRDADGAPLPFAWIAADGTSLSAAVLPSAGEFVLHGVPPTVGALVATAPGHWGRSVAWAGEAVDARLTRQPETRTVAWGQGTVILPGETAATLTAGRLILTRGWAWGSGTGPFVLEAAGATVSLDGGSFALKHLQGDSAWLYVTAGSAAVETASRQAWVVVRPGEMLAFGAGVGRPSPVAMDPAAVRILLDQEETRQPFRPEPSLEARLSETLAHMGLNGAQVLAFVTYWAAVAVVVALPLLALRWWLRRRAGTR